MEKHIVTKADKQKASKEQKRYSNVLNNRAIAMQKIAKGLVKQNKNMKSTKDVNMK